MKKYVFQKVFCCSVTKSCSTLATLWTTAHQASLSSPISWSLLKFMSIESIMIFNRICVFKFISLKYHWFTALLISTVQQSDSVIHTFIFSSIIHFVCNSLFLLIPNSQYNPPPWQPQVYSLGLWFCVCFINNFIRRIYFSVDI